MTLAQVTPERGVAQIAELVPRDLSVEWFAISYDWRKALILPNDRKRPVMVLDFDKAAVVKQCKRPQVADTSLIDQWLADVPGRGPTFEWFATGDDLTRPITQGMVMDPTVPCERSFSSIPPSDVRYLAAHGSPGVGDMRAPEGMLARIDELGTIHVWTGHEDVAFDLRVPSPLRLGLENPFTSIVINDPRMLVVSIGQDHMASPRFLAFRKSDKTWHSVPVQSDWYYRLRAFGNYIAVVEERLKKTILAQRGRISIEMGRKDELGDESAGRDGWRRNTDESSLDLEARFLEAATVYPGRLHLYDLDTERLYTIVTNQGDSEILLVEGKTVYYRIGDRLYSATITDKEIGPPRLLAMADIIHDAHWAFVKH